MREQRTENRKQETGKSFFNYSLFTIHYSLPRSRERGFTLLLAALVASITLSLGAAIFALAQKQIILSSLGRDSQYAFYTADTAAECALYWDSRYKSFPTTTPISVNLTCASEAITTSASIAGNTVASSFQFEPNGYCANVTVSKTRNPVTGIVGTAIRADGFSASCAGVQTSFRLLQRSVELRY